MVGGAMARMIFAEVVGFSIAQLGRWIQQKLITAGYTQLAGKWGLFLVKMGCEESQSPAEIPSPPPQA